ncbi:MAG: VacB/RNase II family 3'-5' exoribonuclease [Defluviitaleaceae bacterium]|nr:VacB/RNase II family 3'-5' exoribonuclease [Defluviitaleaceae bacterium]
MAKRNVLQITGKFVGNERGFGFVLRENGEDIFIPPHSSFGALNGDEVVCRATNDGENRISGKIIEIIKRAPMVGAFFTEGLQGFVRPVDRKIPYVFHVPPKSIARFGLVDGHRVIFSVDKRHKPDEKAANAAFFRRTKCGAPPTAAERKWALPTEARGLGGVAPIGDGNCESSFQANKKVVTCFITEVLGHVNDPGVDVLTLVRMAGVPYEFSEATYQEAFELPTEISESEIFGRLDLREQFIFTIDGDDTKDIDDAISFRKVDEYYLLGVHIADVTHYVKEGSLLDNAAFNRGTSIYLADRVIPMLPHRLSSGICSLFPDVDRLTLSCIMTVDKNGNVVEYKITPSVINSNMRFTYDEVQEMLDIGDDEGPFNEMDELREILSKKRARRGALDFDLPEARIRVDENGRTIAIEPYPRNNATGIIEEFMILCNETIATHFLTRKIPFIYRSHDEPGAEKLSALQTLVTNMGLVSKKSKRLTAGTLQRFLESAKETSAAYAISTAMLRALPQAVYAHDNTTHFGLASKAYCHFTSPIRRYADLQIHRIIKENSSSKIAHFKQILPEVCAQCSRTERAAEALEREVADLKKVQFMADQEGKVFDAIVSGLTAWGMYVMLENTVEGLVPIANLTRYGYKYDKEAATYAAKRRKGEKRARILQYGTAVTVQLVRVSEDERKLIFALKNNS